MKRWFDVVASFIGICILLPFFLLFAIFIIIDSGFPVFYSQKRVGKNGIDFSLLKFRTMKNESDKSGLLTVGERDSRVTAVGYFLRKYKIDELPQLFNVLIGDMSVVGPRPEVKKYVALYDSEQKKVLAAKPGITDYASIEYSKENKLIADSDNPEEFYIKTVMPAKLRMNLKYIDEQTCLPAGTTFLTDLKIIVKTIGKIFS